MQSIVKLKYIKVNYLNYFTLAVIFLITSCNGRTQEAKLSGWDINYMKQVKNDLRNTSSVFTPAFETLIKLANAELERGPYSVTYKDRVPPGGTKNDYMSIGPYWWPDPDKPDGLPYIRRDGVTNPDNLTVDKLQLGSFIHAICNLSLAWFFTEEIQYAERAAQFMRTWFIDPETKMNPHLKYAQGIPGITEGRGIGIIDVRRMFELVNAIALLQTSGALSNEEQEEIKTWFADFHEWLITSKHGKDENVHPNNHSVAYDVVVSSIAFYLGNQDYTIQKLSDMPVLRINPMIKADGSQPEELIRTNAFGYSVFNLENFFDAGETGLKVGVDIFKYVNPEGGSLQQALDFLISYLGKEDFWKWEQIGGWEGVENRLGLLIRRAARYYQNPEYKELWEQRFAEKMKHNQSLLVIPGL